MNHEISRSARAGFTLIEVLLAMSITAMVMVSVSGAFLGLLQARHEVTTLAESTDAGPRILRLIERDLEGLWHFNIKGNRVLVGQSLDIGGFASDRIDFLTSTDAIGAVPDNEGKARHPSVCEIGYWLKESKTPGLLELWRREDPMVDEDLLHGGHFQLVHDRIKSFNITYYETVGHEAKFEDSWDSGRTDTLPRRILIEFTVHRKHANRNQVSGYEIEDTEDTLKTYKRHIVLDGSYPTILQPGVAMVAVLPGPPSQDTEPIGGGGGGGGGGPGTLGGGGAMRISGTYEIRNGQTRRTGDGNQGGGDRGGGGDAGNGGGSGIDFGELIRRGGGGGGGGLFGGGGGRR
jgi:prepilin-type N-terminal cleavage/methylation domain-containing protein